MGGVATPGRLIDLIERSAAATVVTGGDAARAAAVLLKVDAAGRELKTVVAILVRRAEVALAPDADERSRDRT